MSESEGLLLMSDDLAAILGSNLLQTAPAGAETRVSRLRTVTLKSGGTKASFRTSSEDIVSRIVESLTTGSIDLTLSCAGAEMRLTGRTRSARVRSLAGVEREIVVCVAPPTPKYS